MRPLCALLACLLCAASLLAPGAAAELDCAAPQPPRAPAAAAPPAPPLSGPPPAPSALQRYTGRRCLYLPTPDGKYTLEACLYKSLRFIDQENFSIFLGYFAGWAAGGDAVQEYSGGQSWGCAGDAKRSAALRFVCQDRGAAPAVALWQETAPCRYTAHLALPEFCAPA